MAVDRKYGAVTTELGDIAEDEPELAWKTLRIRDRRPTALTWIGRILLIVGGIWLTGAPGIRVVDAVTEFLKGGVA